MTPPVKGPQQYCNVCVHPVRLVYDRVKVHKRTNTIEYFAKCPACGTRQTVSERKASV